jgi:hypothetical protein
MSVLSEVVDDDELLTAFADSDKKFQHQVLALALAADISVKQALRRVHARGVNVTNIHPNGSEIRFRKVVH